VQIPKSQNTPQKTPADCAFQIRDACNASVRSLRNAGRGSGEKRSVERSYRLTNREMNCIVGEEVITWN